MIEIQPAGAKGLGIFATQLIPRGTRIIAEKPLLAVRRERDIFAAYRQLSKSQKAALQQLSINPVQQSNALGWTQATWHAARASWSHASAFQPRADDSNTRPRPVLGLFRFWNLVEEHVHLLRVFRNNNFYLGDDYGGSTSSNDSSSSSSSSDSSSSNTDDPSAAAAKSPGTHAVFDQICRFNHACVPSAQGNFHAPLGAFAVHAVRDVRAGEEVTVSYLAEHAGLRAERQRRLLAGYGFLCGCEACDESTARGRASEERRAEMRGVLRRFAEGGDGGGDGSEGADGRVAAELRVTEALVRLFETEGLRGRELATMCLAAGELCAKLGLRDKARVLAEKGLRVEEECVGRDSPLFQESLRRARALTGSS